MGHVVGQVLVEHGMPVFAPIEGRSERTQGLTRKAGIQSVADVDELVRRVDLILSILVPAAVHAAAGQVADALAKAEVQLAYVECNAIAPATARAIAETISKAGGSYVDAGIIGPPPTQEGLTRFYASGPDPAAFEALTEYGLDVRVVGDQIGQASGFKMCYAALTKGFFALATELLVAAEKQGLYQQLISEFEISQVQRYNSMLKDLPSTPPKVGRWVGEMEEIARTFSNLGLTPKIHQGAAEVFRRASKSAVASETTETRDEGRSLADLIEILAHSSDSDI